VRSCALIEQVCLLVYINQSQRVIFLLPFVIFFFLLCARLIWKMNGNAHLCMRVQITRAQNMRVQVNGNYALRKENSQKTTRLSSNQIN